MVVLLSFSGLLLLSGLPAQPGSSPEPRFLETIRVVSARVPEGEVSFVNGDGESRTLVEGDALDEEGGATLKDVTSASLVFTRPVTGGAGEVGESLIVVRFDASGKTKVREYRTVGDVAPPRPPRDERLR